MPEADTVFVETHLSEVEKAVSETLDQPVSAMSVLDGIRRIATLRRGVMETLDRTLSLSSLNGIETLDTYDHGATLALYDLTAAFVAQDSTPPQADHLQRFNRVLGGFPTLGETPTGFMVFGVVDLALIVADTLWSDPGLSRPTLAKTVIRFIHVGTDLYHEVHVESLAGDLTQATKTDSFRRNSVIMRLRCPEDDSVYKVVDIRNRVSEDGGINSVYYLQCQACRDKRVVEFRDEFKSRISKMAERQKLKRDRARGRSGLGVDP
jgi:hypothetical protein